MTEPLTISSNPPVNPGVDYARLRQEGIEIVQDLSGDVWTDYNESDPGVTTLEQLCYALTELSYRAEIPLEDLLVDAETGRIDPQRQALFPAWEIFPVNPVTVDDYRKLLIDRVPDLLNVWLHPRKPKGRCRVRGLYDIAVYMREAHECGDDEKDRIKRRVRRVYASHRNLTEDLRAVWVLKPERTVVFADVTIGEDARPEPLLADLYFSLGLLFAPEPSRRSLESELAAGRSPSQIFDGPLLLHGFIDDCQLCPKPSEISLPTVADTILDHSGVRTVSDLKVRYAGETYRGDATIEIPKRQVPRLDVENRRDKRFSIRLFRHGIEIELDAARVERELAARWQRHRRTYDLRREYEELLPFPQGTHRDVRAYESVQNQYPAVYGIGEDGLPPDATELRRAQARQLKGYLLVFDQLMADFFAQLSRVRDLYSTDEDLARTYFFQYLEDVVPNVDPLLNGYRAGLPELVESQDPVVRRRNRFSAFLLALYAESLDAADLWQAAPADGHGEAEVSGLRRLEAQLALLRNLVAATRNRGRGFDYLAPPSGANRAGMEIKSRIELNMEPAPRSLVDVLDEWSVEPAEDDAAEASEEVLQRYEAEIDEELEAVGERLEEELEDEELPAALPSGLRMTEEMLDAAARGVEVRMGRLPGGGGVVVVWRPVGKESWRRLGRFPDEGAAHHGCHSFHRFLRHLRVHGQQLWIVEHDLLRWGRWRRCDHHHHHRHHHHHDHHHHRHDHGRGSFDYDFTITAVISTFPHLRRDESYRKFAREVLRQNAPSHVAVDVCFLGSWNTFRFERRYWAWRRALRKGGRRARREASRDLRCFLERHCREKEKGRGGDR